MTGAILHDRGAEIAAGQTPGLGDEGHRGQVRGHVADHHRDVLLDLQLAQEDADLRLTIPGGDPGGVLDRPEAVEPQPGGEP